MITGPELEGDDVTGKCVDAVWREVMCIVADFDCVYSDFALLDGESGGVDGSCRTFDFLTRCDARQGSETQGRQPGRPNAMHLERC